MRGGNVGGSIVALVAAARYSQRHVLRWPQAPVLAALPRQGAAKSSSGVIVVPFTTVCPFCGRSFRLLDRYRDRKIMCSECRKPFIAVSARADTVEVADGEAELPEAGWLLVCPACGHTEVVADEDERRTHCSRCSTALGDPRTASKKIRKRDEPS